MIPRRRTTITAIRSYSVCCFDCVASTPPTLVKIDNRGSNHRGVNRTRARYLLEASAGNVGLASALYWEDYLAEQAEQGNDGDANQEMGGAASASGAGSSASASSSTAAVAGRRSKHAKKQSSPQKKRKSSGSSVDCRLKVPLRRNESGRV